ncbi:DUF6691 family protein [Stenotrophomonas sp. TWI602]|jgi:uncharacterized membrane protein YedE/YeeE|uniref:DUF6691 family protein n=1 Tax=Stenotrophomonas sp. TWI602 TaxID=3136786 RepID=UPI00320AF93C
MSRQILVALGAGALFGLGLAVSGMTDPLRILGFLDVTGAFDPSLLFVLGGAVATTALLFRFVLRAPRPRLADQFHLSDSQRIDTRLLGGAALFGIGWGLAGYCPGPALVGAGYGASEALWFVPAMLVGMALHRGWAGRAERVSSA